jgi:hypothetical protein
VDSELIVEKTENRFSDRLGSEIGPVKHAGIASTKVSSLGFSPT